jgi:phosphoribosylformylglycinamidine cyclo-ligase
MAPYRESGVDLDLSGRCSRVLYEAALQTFADRKGRFGEPCVEYGGFSGPVYIPELEDAYLLKNSDGVGTKVEVAEKLGKHDTIAFDLLAMVCDDAAAMGAEPFAVTNTLNVRELNVRIIGQLARGLAEAAGRARVAVVGGELAVLGKRIEGEYIWDADCLAVLERSKAFRKDSIDPGDRIVGLREKGFRSNGFSLIRVILEERYGPDWVHAPYDAKRTWGEVALTPSVIYTPILVDAVGAYGEPPKAKIDGAAHITGGGIPGNLPRCLPKGLGARVSVEPLEPMVRLQELGDVGDREAYRVWNMGVGMLFITNDDHLFEIAHEHGVEACEVGEVIDEPKIIIENRGAFRRGKELVYEIER